MNPTIHRNPINLLRALAVMLVFCHHYMHYAKTDLGLIGTYGGLLGVQLFFLISGYLIVKTASLQSWPSFLRGRVLRIFPTYWFILLLASWFYQPVLPFTAADAPYFWINFFALSHFVPYALVKFDVLTVSWTLTIEWTW
jgi:exopolysaccharide production protein ExoZ